MPKRTVRISRDQPGGLTPGSHGRNGPGNPQLAQWTNSMGASSRGAKEVLVKISGGGRDADGVQAHLEYVDRHGKLDLENDEGERVQGKDAATRVVNDWGLGYAQIPGAPHSSAKSEGAWRPPRQAFNIVLSMPAGTDPKKVLEASKKFAREEFAFRHRYVMALHVEHKDNKPVHPHVHLVVKAEPEFGGRRLNPRKADLQRWRERFAANLTELGVPATATRRHDRGLIKTHKKTPIYRASQRSAPAIPAEPVSYRTLVGDSTFMRRKLNAVRREMEHDEGRGGKEVHSLLNVRAAVGERYREAIAWLRSNGREEEARRFELMYRNLAPVRSENELIASQVAAPRKSGLHGPGAEYL